MVLVLTTQNQLQRESNNVHLTPKKGDLATHAKNQKKELKKKDR